MEDYETKNKTQTKYEQNGHSVDFNFIMLTKSHGEMKIRLSNISSASTINV